MFAQFEWDSQKRLANLKKHEIDFEDAVWVFKQPVIIKPGHLGEGGELRYIAIGLLSGIEITIVYTLRGESCRLISARQASANERAAYRQAFPEQSA